MYEYVYITALPTLSGSKREEQNICNAKGERQAAPLGYRQSDAHLGFGRSNGRERESQFSNISACDAWYIFHQHAVPHVCQSSSEVSTHNTNSNRLNIWRILEKSINQTGSIRPRTDACPTFLNGYSSTTVRILAECLRECIRPLTNTCPMVLTGCSTNILLKTSVHRHILA